MEKTKNVLYSPHVGGEIKAGNKVSYKLYFLPDQVGYDMIEICRLSVKKAEKLMNLSGFSSSV